METNFICKSKVDDAYIKQTQLQFDSLKHTSHKFLNNLSKQANNFFIQCGYLPQNETDANNFLNSIAKLNEQQQYNISYALQGLPENKQFALDKNTAVYALHPNIWQNLAVEDKMVCLNFIYKNICEKRYIKSNYRLIWIDDHNGSTDCASTNRITKELYLGLDNVLINNKYFGLQAASLIAHEVNHMIQFKQSDLIDKTANYAKLNTYEQALGSNNALLVLLDYDNNYLDAKHAIKYNKIKNTPAWQNFLRDIYFNDYLEISSGNIQRKEFYNFAKQAYGFFNQEPTDDKFFVLLSENLKNHYNRDIGESIFDNLDEINKLKTLCGLVELNIDNLFFARRQAANLTCPEKPEVINLLKNAEDELVQIQRNIFCTLIDTFENSNKIPESFDRSLFDNIPHLLNLKNFDENTLLDIFMQKAKAEKQNSANINDQENIL